MKAFKFGVMPPECNSIQDLLKAAVAIRRFEFQIVRRKPVSQDWADGALVFNDEQETYDESVVLDYVSSWFAEHDTISFAGDSEELWGFLWNLGEFITKGENHE